MYWKHIEGNLVVWLKQVCSLMILASPQLNCRNQIKVFTGLKVSWAFKILFYFSVTLVAGENSQHFMMPSLLSLLNGV